MERVYNFSAGPAVLPVPVLEQVQAELLSYNGSGMSVMELSHRSSWFQQIMDDAEALLRELMNIPSNYQVLFLQGGASLQFSMVPMNLAKNKKIAFVDTGSWSKKSH
ncbi:phosphoserine aminotransferase domain protein [Carnobacterium maltaromaticum LMA28]|uniref:Phosphoserine aminotransferase n=1 Tax=Carnobacterium maltaromaticum LMA28 TaxID=1234679 RepID=K8E2M3_CARML|nr:phosphoserine aminotransferase domain protein [Carnobacterium maltaromaticum LMA28]